MNPRESETPAYFAVLTLFAAIGLLFWTLWI
jgi:hypothetical protein